MRLVACGVCHTDLYTASGVDPSGYAPTVLGHEGAGVVERLGEGVDSLALGDHVVTLFSPQCGECIHCRSPLTNLCLAIREQQNQGYLPDGTTRLLARRRADAPLHGHLDVRAVHGDARRSRSRRSTRRRRSTPPACSPAASRPASARRCARPRCARARPASSSAPGWSGSARSPAAGCSGAERIVCVDLSPARLELARGQGATDTLIGGPDAVAAILEMTGGFGADYTFEATGNVAVMRQAVEAARMGWGLCTVAGVAGRGETLDIIPRYLITGRRVCGSSFGGPQGPRRRARS